MHKKVKKYESGIKGAMESMITRKKMSVALQISGTKKLVFLLPEYHFFGMNAIFSVAGKMATLFLAARIFVSHVDSKNKKHSSVFKAITRKNEAKDAYRIFKHDISGLPGN